MAASFLTQIFQRTRSRRRVQARQTLSSLAALESRTLLAGNVTAKLLGKDLYLTGDSAANDVYITETSAGMIVRGVNGTKINGSEADFVAYTASVVKTGSIIATLGKGDDRLQLDNLTLDVHLIVTGGQGHDQLGLTNATLHGNVVFNGDSGNDTLYSEGATIDGYLTTTLGSGNDLVVTKSTHVKKTLTVVGVSGADRISLDSTTLDEAFHAFLGKGNDDIRMSNGTTIERVYLLTGGGSDLVQMVDTTITDSYFAHLGSGADNVAMSGTTDINGSFMIFGGRKIDMFEQGSATLPTTQHLFSIYRGTVSSTLIASRIDEPTTGLLAAVNTARSAFFALTGTFNSIATGTGVLKTGSTFVSDKTTVGVKITGVAGQTYEVDKDGDGFDDGSVRLDSTGTATVSITLANTTAATTGLNSILVRQVFNGSQVGSTQTVSVQYTNTVVARIATSMGDVDVQLFVDDLPVTTQNFVNYLSRYADSIIHRSAHTTGNAPFIIQGGGFDLGPPVAAIPADSPITNEFKAAHSNVRGSLSMATVGGNINSGTSQWFINTANNNASGTVNLDSVPHTVFGQVLGSGMTIVDAIHALTSYNLVGPLDNGAMGEVPLAATYVPFTVTLTGTVSVTSGTDTVTGAGTSFLTDLQSGMTVQIDGTTYTVSAVTSDTAFTIVENASATVTDETAKVNATPLDSEYVKINSVTLIPQLT